MAECTVADNRRKASLAIDSQRDNRRRKVQAALNSKCEWAERDWRIKIQIKFPFNPVLPFVNGSDLAFGLVNSGFADVIINFQLS